MTKLKIEGVHPGLDGEYEFDATYFTNGELHAIKNLSGLRVGEFEEAFSMADNDLVVSLAMVALVRQGKVRDFRPWLSEEVQTLWNAPVGKIVLDVSEAEEEDERPPETLASEPENAASASARNVNSGGSSKLSSGSPASAPSSTGDPT